jgi:SOS-response transcriptional repressor LexA
MILARELTDRQRELLGKLEEFVQRTGRLASYGDMADAMKCSRNNIRQLVKPLLRKGFLASTPGVANSLRPTSIRFVASAKDKTAA